MYFSMQEDRQEDSPREREVDCEVGVMQWLKQFLWGWGELVRIMGDLLEARREWTGQERESARGRGCSHTRLLSESDILHSGHFLLFEEFG